MQPMVSRLAPTPSGYLHPGNGFSFVLTWLLVRRAGGRLLLRIDDLDNDRFRPDYLSDLFRALEWLGLDWDLGPSGPDDFMSHFSQRHRMPLYTGALEALAELGELFACDCSRKQVQLQSSDGQYFGRCRERRLSLELHEVSWRLKTPVPLVSASPETGRVPRPDADLVVLHDEMRPPVTVSLWKSMRDVVVRKRDGNPAYQLASVVDDLHFGVNWIVRGEDLAASSAFQCYLAERLASGLRAGSCSTSTRERANAQPPDQSTLERPSHNHPSSADSLEAPSPSLSFKSVTLLTQLQPGRFAPAAPAGGTHGQPGAPDRDSTHIHFAHHPLLLGDNEVKLSKSAGDFSLRMMQAREGSPGRFLAWVGRNLGLTLEPEVSLQTLLQEFTGRERLPFWPEGAHLEPLPLWQA